jgi:hypothetical protein
LIALEVPPVKTEVRQILQRRLYRKDKYFGGGGRGEVILICRCICESIGNEGALNEPIIVSAVASCLEPKFIDRGVALIEAFDKIPLVEILRTMRGLDLFSENSALLFDRHPQQTRENPRSRRAAKAAEAGQGKARAEAAEAGQRTGAAHGGVEAKSLAVSPLLTGTDGAPVAGFFIPVRPGHCVCCAAFHDCGKEISYRSR